MFFVGIVCSKPLAQPLKHKQSVPVLLVCFGFVCFCLGWFGLVAWFLLV